MSPLDLTPQDLLKLSDAELREMIRRLCEAELASQNLPTSAVLAGGAQEAADGGLDVVVKLNQPLKTPNFIPRPYTGFQVKKHGMTPKNCQDEMLYHGKAPKNVICELAAASGAYIMVTTDNCSDSMLKNRLDSMLKTVSTLPNHDQILLDFYGIDRLNQWLSLFPGTQLWVRECIGQPLTSWQSHGRWTTVPTEDNDAYITDKQPHLTDISEGQAQRLTLAEGLTRFRTLLKKPQAILRLTGLSGTGKTRFAQALFEATVGNDALLPSEAIYADIGDTPFPVPAAMIEQLIAKKRRAIVVIDNCAPEIHRQLVRKIRDTANQSVSLLTIEYDVADDEPEETRVFRLETSAPSLTVDLLQRRYPSLSYDDADRLDKLSDGNTRLALALAQHVAKSGNLPQFSDRDLFQRLFNQRHAEDRHLLQEAQVLSLVYSFRISNNVQDNQQDELQVLADLAELPRRNLLSAVATLKQRQLIQSRGQWHAVLPQALANYLAVQALDSLSLRTVQQYLTIPQNSRLLKSYAHRLGTLPPHQAVISVAAIFIKSFKLRERLLENDSEALTLLEFIAPVIEDDVLTLLEDLFDTPDFHPDDGNRLARLLWHLAYEERNFKKAVQLLLKLIPLAPKDDVASYLTQLFFLLLSGTLATPAYRLEVLTELIDNDYSEVVDLELPHLFNAAFKSSHWTLAIDCSFGTRTRSAGWDLPQEAPTGSINPIHTWYFGLLNLLSSANLIGRPAFSAVMDVLLFEFHCLWQQGFCCTALEQLCLRLVEDSTSYLLILRMVNHSLKMLRLTKADPVVLLRLETLRQKLQRTDLLSTTCLTLHSSLQDLSDESDDCFCTKTAENVRQLGRTVGSKLALLLPHIENVLWINQTTHFPFGIGLSESTTPPEATLRLLIQSFEKQLPQSNLDVLLGFLYGVEQQSLPVAETLIKQCLKSKTLQPYSVQVLFSYKLANWKIPLLMSMAEDTAVPFIQFTWLSCGQRHASLSDADFIHLLQSLNRRPDSLYTVLELIYMRLYQENHNNYSASTDLIHYIADILRQLLLNGTSHQFQVRVPVDIPFIYRRVLSVLPTFEQPKHAEALCSALCRRGVLVSDVSPFLQTWLEVSPCALFNALEKHSDDKRLILRLSEYFNGNLCHYSVNRVAWGTVASWCNASETRLKLMLQLTTVLVRENQFETAHTGSGLHLSERALALLDASNDKKTATELIVQLARHPRAGGFPYSGLLSIHRDACAALLSYPSKIVRDTAAPLINAMDQEIVGWQERESVEEQESSTFE